MLAGETRTPLSMREAAFFDALPLGMTMPGSIFLSKLECGRGEMQIGKQVYTAIMSMSHIDNVNDAGPR
ncbi:hypothetical protein [Pseudogulbenkiania sp. MAI-1]|uniref:hypothetical protein n=1 Tax=Pseudogulbenkiania sp. MAI-1 TaxID=990370 RepID=UPI00045EC401|nr:hypothetical protein [Pseudogulbenkiania sp. MAI-1]